MPPKCRAGMELRDARRDEINTWRPRCSVLGRLAEESELPPMAKVARTIRKHSAGILRRLHFRISNGMPEAMSSLVQEAHKARARGYRTINVFTACESDHRSHASPGEKAVPIARSLCTPQLPGAVLLRSYNVGICDIGSDTERRRGQRDRV